MPDALKTEQLNLQQSLLCLCLFLCLIGWIFKDNNTNCKQSAWMVTMFLQTKVLKTQQTSILISNEKHAFF